MTSDATPLQITLTAMAMDLAVRDILTRSRNWLRGHDLPDGICGIVELVLAEALNNIVEHAYAKDEPGEILMAATLTPARLICLLSDHGTALPGLKLPGGGLPDHDVARDDLPEGGFGWFLIRDLTDRIDYRHRDGWNLLTLEFRLDAA